MTHPGNEDTSAQQLDPQQQAVKNPRQQVLDNFAAWQEQLRQEIAKDRQQKAKDKERRVAAKAYDQEVQRKRAQEWPVPNPQAERDREEEARALAPYREGLAQQAAQRVWEKEFEVSGALAKRRGAEEARLRAELEARQLDQDQGQDQGRG